MTQTVTTEMTSDSLERLDRFVESNGNGTTRSQALAVLIEEKLREVEFPGVDFRETAIGRQPFVSGTGLTMWEYLMVGQCYDLNAEQIANHFCHSIEKTEAFLRYYAAFPKEVETELAKNDIGYEDMLKENPNIQLFYV